MLTGIHHCGQKPELQMPVGAAVTGCSADWRQLRPAGNRGRVQRPGEHVHRGAVRAPRRGVLLVRPEQAPGRRHQLQRGRRRRDRGQLGPRPDGAPPLMTDTVRCCAIALASALVQIVPVIM